MNYEDYKLRVICHWGKVGQAMATYDIEGTSLSDYLRRTGIPFSHRNNGEGFVAYVFNTQESLLGTIEAMTREHEYNYKFKLRFDLPVMEYYDEEGEAWESIVKLLMVPTINHLTCI